MAALLRRLSLFFLIVISMKCGSTTGSQDDFPVVSLQKTLTEIAQETGTFTVTAHLDREAPQKLIVPFSVSGTARTSLDHNCSGGEFVFYPGDRQHSQTYNITNIVSDQSVIKSVIITLTPVDSVVLGTSMIDTVLLRYQIPTSFVPPDSIQVPVVSLAHISRTFTRRSGTFTVTARLSTLTTEAVEVPFTVVGSAVAPVYHNCSDGRFIFQPGQTEQSLTYNLVDHPDETGFRTLVIALSASSGADSEDGATDSITIVYDSIVRFQFLKNDVTGWYQSSFDSDLNAAEGEGLYTVINGGALPYIKHQYTVALWQVMTNDAEQVFSLMSMRYPSSVDADSLYHLKIKPDEETGEDNFTLTLDGYDRELVSGAPAIGGMLYLMHFGSTYFELTLSGFSVSDDAVAFANGIAALLQSRLGSL